MWLLRTSRPHCQCAHATSGSTGNRPRSCDRLMADFRLAALRPRRSIFCSEATEKEVLLGTDTASIVRPQRCRRSRRSIHACYDCCARALMSQTPKIFDDKNSRTGKKMVILKPKNGQRAIRARQNGVRLWIRRDRIRCKWIPRVATRVLSPLRIFSNPPYTGQKKNPTLEPKFAVAASPHVKSEFRYESGMVELGLGDFLGSSSSFLADFNFQ